MPSLKKLLLHSLVVLALSASGWCTVLTSLDGELVITKDLAGAPGPDNQPAMANSDFTLSFAWGEPISGDLIRNSTYTLISGYYGGRFGNSETFQLLSSHVGRPGTTLLFQDNLPVGVPFDAPIQATFSDPLDLTTTTAAVHVNLVTDHLGNAVNQSVAVSVSTTTSNQVLTIQPQGAWVGNSLYDVQLTPLLLNLDGFPLDEVYHVYFLTLIDHHQENVVLDPLTPPGAPAAAGTEAIGAMSIHIPSESLADYSTVLASRDPLMSPLRVDPKIIQAANDKARADGGAYQVPLAVQEITAYNAKGDPMGPLSKPAWLTIDYGSGISSAGSPGALVRPQTLALYVLDQAHRLWIKIPASQNAAAGHTVSAPVTQLTVFALMGSADGSASDTYVFPVPWRPHGPNAGAGSGQTGTEADGLNFVGLPSECTIKIYTLAGDLVREIHHSDAGSPLSQGRESWDAKTAHGDPAASGVYLWRVDSSVDGKNGKLMIIR